MVELNLYDIFCTDTLRHRETARKLLQKIPKKTRVVLNFERIDFASRSFLHELLCGLNNNKKVSFSNMNTEVEQMMNIIQKKTVCVHC
mgnify:CR=1 FL=1